MEVDSNAVSSYGVSTPVRFDSLAQGQRGALTVIGTNLYVPYGGLYGDCSTYHGWIVGMPLTNPTNVVAWATSVNGGGAWSVGGIASDGCPRTWPPATRWARAPGAAAKPSSVFRPTSC